jgi:hypothetical protein
MVRTSTGKGPERTRHQATRLEFWRQRQAASVDYQRACRTRKLCFEAEHEGAVRRCTLRGARTKTSDGFIALQLHSFTASHLLSQQGLHKREIAVRKRGKLGWRGRWEEKGRGARRNSRFNYVGDT